MRLLALLLTFAPIAPALAQQAAPPPAAGRTAAPDNKDGLIGLEQEGVHRPKEGAGTAKVPKAKARAVRAAEGTRATTSTPTPR